MFQADPAWFFVLVGVYKFCILQTADTAFRWPTDETWLSGGVEGVQTLRQPLWPYRRFQEAIRTPSWTAGRAYPHQTLLGSNDVAYECISDQFR